MGDHAKLSPSASHRWITCPGSIALIDSLPSKVEEVSPYAREGSAAHELASICLSGWTDPKLLKGQASEDYPEFPYTEEMIAAVEVYVEYVRACVSLSEVKAGNMVFGVEKRFDLSWLFPKIFGTTDAYVYDAKRRFLSVFDYKHGSGVSVEPDWNPQLMIYGLGALRDIWMARNAQGIDTNKSAWQMVEQVKLCIVQPRVFGEQAVREWLISSEELYHWGFNVLRQAAQAAETKDAPRYAGEHCRFCDALAVCPAQAQQALAVAQTTFADPTFPAPDELTPEQILQIMNVADLINAWVSGVKGFAQMQMESGISYPGLKLVQKRSNRAWIDAERVEQEMGMILGDEAYAPAKLLPVAQMEKALKANKLFSVESFNALVHKPDNGLTMAADSDKRKEVVPSTLLDFMDTADFFAE